MSPTDLLYRQTVPINGTPVELEVIDVSGSNADKFPTEQVIKSNIIHVYFVFPFQPTSVKGGGYQY